MGEGAAALHSLPPDQLLLSLTSTQGLCLWTVVRSSWFLWCDIMFRGEQHVVH